MQNKFISFEFVLDGKSYSSTINIDKVLYFERYKVKFTRFYLIDGTIIDVLKDYTVVKDIVDKALENQKLV